MDPSDLTPLYSPKEVEERVASLGMEISRDFEGRQPLLVCVLQGAFVFFSDLIRQIPIPVRCDFIQASSYGSGTEGSHPVEIVQDPRADLSGRHVILVEDIVDTGRTARAILDRLHRRGPASLCLCTLLDKRERREKDVEIRYRGFVVPNRFVVGYGLDLDGLWRNRAGLWTIPHDGGPTPDGANR